MKTTIVGGMNKYTDWLLWKDMPTINCNIMAFDIHENLKNKKHCRQFHSITVIRKNTSLKQVLIISNIYSFPCHRAISGLRVCCNCPNKRAWSAVTAVSSAAWPFALLANVVHQQKREREWGDFSAECPTQKRIHKDSPSPTLPLIHTHKHTWSLLLRMAPPCSWHYSLGVARHGVMHTYTPLRLYFPVGWEGSNTWNQVVCFCPGPTALGNSPTRRPALPRH